MRAECRVLVFFRIHIFYIILSYGGFLAKFFYLFSFNVVILYSFHQINFLMVYNSRVSTVDHSAYPAKFSGKYRSFLLEKNAPEWQRKGDDMSSVNFVWKFTTQNLQRGFPL